MTIFGQQLTLSKGRFFTWRKKAEAWRVSSPNQPNLAGAPLGSQVQVTGFNREIPAERRNQLAAYGLTPGAMVRVLQHSPVTIIQIEHIELAMESDLARHVQVQAAPNA